MTKILIIIVSVLAIFFIMLNIVENDNERLRKINTQFEKELKIYNERRKVN